MGSRLFTPPTTVPAACLAALRPGSCHRGRHGTGPVRCHRHQTDVTLIRCIAVSLYTQRENG